MQSNQPGPQGTIEPPTQPVPSSDPSARPDEVRRLSGRVMLLWRLPGIVATVIMAVITVIAVAAGAPVGLLIGLLVLTALALGWATVIPSVRYRSWSYRVGPDQLDISRGIIVRREATIPYFRVQHIDLSKGPLERLRSVVILQISTASAATDATLPGIDPVDADRLRTYVLARAGLEDGV